MAVALKAPLVLGVSLPNHNGAACLVAGDEIIVAVQEERLNRLKRSTIRDPMRSLAVDYCLEYAGLTMEDLDLMVLGPMQGDRSSIRIPFEHPPVISVSHHLAHAIGVFATSGFSDAAILIADGCGHPIKDLTGDERGVIKPSRYPASCFGEPREIITIYRASGTECIALEKYAGFVMDFELKHRMPDFGSLGGIFNAAAQQIFGNITDAGKVMGLAAYGRPQLSPDEILSIDSDGCLIFHDTIPRLFPYNERWPAHKQEYEDLALCVQTALENALKHLVDRTQALTSSPRLCYAGGVALNGLANEKIIYRSDFDEIYIMPAAEDSGGAIGAAYYGLWRLTGRNTRRKLRRDAVGRRYSASDVAAAVKRTPCVTCVGAEEELLDVTVDALCDGNIVGWFQDGSELGPRALGQRSILCDPRRAEAKEILNERVKHRESFRPFAATVLLEEMANWFEVDERYGAEGPFMLRVFRLLVEARRGVPAVSHVDFSGRVQTVTREVNGRFYDLIERFYRKTGVPMLLNTSFNVMGEPIVESPEDALWCLLYTGVDLCVLDDIVVRKVSSERGILDLTPRRAISGVRMEFRTLNGSDPLLFDAGDADEIVVQSRNRWGPVSTTLNGDAVVVLAEIDAKRVGYEIARDLRETRGFTEQRVIKALGELRRAACIAYGNDL